MCVTFASLTSLIAVFDLDCRWVMTAIGIGAKLSPPLPRTARVQAPFQPLWVNQSAGRALNLDFAIEIGICGGHQPDCREVV